MDLLLPMVHCGGMFFSAYCQEAGTKVLLGPGNFVDLNDGPMGFELHYTCHCGRAGIVCPKLGTGACTDLTDTATA